GIHQFNEVFHNHVYAIFVKRTMIAKAEKVEFQAFALYHFYVGEVADTNLCKVGLPCNGAKTCKFGAVEAHPIVIFGMFIVKSL
ncbi:hypothetical protein EZS27_035127, partial [termite gut metagenome]